MIQRHNLSQNYKAFVSLAGLAVVYIVLVFVLLPRHVFFCGDEGEKVVVAASAARRGDVWHVAFEYPGHFIDPKVRFFFSPWMRVVDGQPVPYHLSTMTFLNAPLYALFGIDGLYLLPLLAGLAIAWLAYQLARLLDAPNAWAVILIVGLCTPVFFYSLTTWDHMPTVFYSTLAVYLAARQTRKFRWWEMSIAGAVLGLGLWTRLEMYLFVPAFVLSYLYVFRRERGVWPRLLPAVLGFAVVMAGMVAQHIAVYGQFDLIAWSTRTASIEKDSQATASVIDALRNIIFRQAQVLLALTVDGSALWLDRVFLTAAFASVVVVNRFEKLGKKPLLVMGSALMLGLGVILALVRPRMYNIVGLVTTLPLSAFGLVYKSPSPDEQKDPARLALDFVATAGVTFLLLGLFLLPSYGGLSWGPRYLSQLFPLLAVLAWATWRRLLAARAERLSRQAVHIAFALLLIFSLVMQLASVRMLFETKQSMIEWYEGTRAFDTQYILSDQRFYLQNMAALYFERYFLCPRTQDDYQAVVTQLEKHGVQRFAWVPSEVTTIEPQFTTSTFSVHPVDDFMFEIIRIE